MLRRYWGVCGGCQTRISTANQNKDIFTVSHRTRKWLLTPYLPHFISEVLRSDIGQGNQNKSRLGRKRLWLKQRSKAI